MNDPHDTEAQDDAIAEAIADRLVELAQRPGVLRLAALQMAGIVGEGKLECSEIARGLGCTTRRIQQIQEAALAKLALNAIAKELMRSLHA